MKYALTACVADCLHEGHIDLLTEMNKIADVVFVVLHDDYSTFLNKGRFPVQDVEHRERNLLLSGLVEGVFITEDTNPIETVKDIIASHPDDIFVFMRGDDWKDAPGIKELEEMGVPILFKPYLEGVSSTEIRKHLPQVE